jgi:hypothetical protein
VLGGAVFADIAGELRLLGVYDITFFTIALVTFEYVIED